MKNLSLTAIVFLFFVALGCSNEGKNGEVAVNEATDTQSATAKCQPCKSISRSMVLTYFGLEEEDLEQIEKVNRFGYKDCGFVWRKSNYEELRDQKLQAILTHKATVDSTFQNYVDPDVYDAAGQVGSPFGEVLVENFQKFKSKKEAANQFLALHQLETKHLAKKMNYSRLSDRKKVDFIAKDQRQLIPINNLGDKAIFDKNSNSLDVLKDQVIFKISIDSEFDQSINMHIAKELAKEVLESFEEDPKPETALMEF